ncbi:MAG: hypothetical protein BroJett040_13200 [Oligoflexia bacterium]|nr:MAG: hypothetical protein BroJett040_13200 [Oligoflexia bacterium]
MKILRILFLFFSITAQAAIEPKEACQSAKEFITTYEFLKTKSQLFGQATEMAKAASQAAQGCTGSAKRFIKVVSTLEKSDLTAGDIVRTATQVAQKSDAVAEAFVQIFQRAYATDGFDLDLQSAIQVAKSLSIDFKGEVDMAMKDFTKISNFCLGKNGLDYTKPQCGKMAQRMALYSDQHGLEVGDAFLTAIKYMTSKSGPELTMGEAVKLSEEVVKLHPSGTDDFQIAYQYAVSKKGLNLKRDEAIKFAKKMALQDVDETKLETQK